MKVKQVLKMRAEETMRRGRPSTNSQGTIERIVQQR